MSDTPRTDGKIMVNQIGHGPFAAYLAAGHSIVKADFARQLERELNETVDALVPALECASGLKRTDFADQTTTHAALWMARAIMEKSA